MTEYQSKCLKVGNQVKHADGALGIVAEANYKAVKIKWADSTVGIFDHNEMQDIEPEPTEQEYQQMLANCFKTWYGAIGHKKSQRCKEGCDLLKDAMRKRGFAIPDDQTLLEIGIFNGWGSC